MSAPNSLQARVEQLLVERRQLGFSTRDGGYVLRSDGDQHLLVPLGRCPS